MGISKAGPLNYTMFVSLTFPSNRGPKFWTQDIRLFGLGIGQWFVTIGVLFRLVWLNIDGPSFSSVLIIYPKGHLYL